MLRSNSSLARLARADVTFLDISIPLLDAAALRACVNVLAERYQTTYIMHIAGIDAWFFSIACAGSFTHMMTHDVIKEQNLVACALNAWFIMLS